MQRHVAKKYCYNKSSIKKIMGEENMKTKEDKKNGQTLIFQNFPFWTYIQKIAHSLFGAWSFSLVHIHFTHVEGPKGFVN